MNDLSKRIAALPPEVQDLLLQQLMQEDGKQPTLDTIPMLSRGTNTFSLSFSQQRMWLLDQLEPGNPAYNISGAIRLTGQLNLPALEKSLTEIVRRHEALRTTFSMVNEQPVQVIHSPTPFLLSIVDLSTSPEGTREAHVQELVATEALYQFDLVVGPLIRATIYKLDETDHVLAMVSHHIISDGWSSAVLVKELRTLYPVFAQGLPSPLPELAVQYVDYAHWQRTLIEDGKLEPQLTYWKQQLSGDLSGLLLPFDHPRPAMHTYHGATRSLELSNSLREKLEALGQHYGTTLFMTLLAAFKVLLHRYSGQEDLIVVSPIASRNRLEIEGLIGCFINTLALRTDLSGNPSFRELLNQVQRVTMAAYENQDLPIEIPMEHIRPMRIHDQNLLFQVAFIYQNYPQVEIELGDLKLSRWEIEKQVAALDLSLYIREENGCLAAIMEYNNDLFDETTVKRMLLHYETLLESIVANPEQTVTALPMLTSAETQQMLVEWNASETVFPRESCFPELFEAQVLRTPDNIAVACDGKMLTYDQLNRRANQLARLLVEHEVGPDVVVALLDFRGIDLLTAILAVFKAGGAYLPLDPYHPPERISQVLLQSKTSLVIFSSEFEGKIEQALSNWSKEEHPKQLSFDSLWSQQRSEDNLSPRSNPRDLAYVIFTSGSTGLPKGAMVEQVGMINHLFAKISALNLSVNDRIAETASQCFDISVWQFLVLLILGGRVHIYSDEITHDPARLLECVEQDEISILETVPSMMRAMLDAVVKTESARLDLSALRWFIPTGEALPPDLSRQWFDYFPNIPLLNAYGPTECSDDVTHYPIYEAPSADVINMPIGRPINNMKMYVLDKHLRPVPIGVPGELFVGGVGVGRGYLNDPQRTADAFLPDPFSQEPPARLYKTGDLVRYLPDGNLEFLGRADFQVKIRGYRIELGEIEAVLARHSDVSEVVVMARQDHASDKQLVAYLVPSEGCSPSLQELRGFLQKHLPDYMVPSYFVLLEAFPLSPNGKINRKALPAPDRTKTEREDQYVAPRDPTEETITRIFATVLNLQRVSIYENFFDLGGHSLLASQVIARLRKDLHIQLPLKSVFEAPVAEELAKQIKAILRIQEDQLQVIPPLTAEDREEFQL